MQTCFAKEKNKVNANIFKRKKHNYFILLLCFKTNSLLMDFLRRPQWSLFGIGTSITEVYGLLIFMLSVTVTHILD